MSASVKKVLWHDWENSTEAEMLATWNAPADALAGAELLAAAYTYEDYSGSAHVLFRRDGKLYEVNGGHCSCWGLEDQWAVEEVVPSADAARKWSGYSAEYADHVRAILLAEVSP